MPKRGENIYKRKDGRWEGRYPKGYSLEGKIMYGYVYDKTYKDVKQKLLNAKRNKEYQNIPKQVFNVNQLMEKWLIYTNNSVKQSTYALYNTITKNHIIPSIGDVKLVHLNSVIINQFLSNKLSNGRLDGNGGLSAKSVKDIAYVLKSAIKYGESEFNLAKISPYITLPKTKYPDIKVLSKSEQGTIIMSILEQNNTENIGVLISLFTGIRIGELCALKWKDIQSNCIYIHTTIQRIKNTDTTLERKTKIIFDTPKSSCSVRAIPMPQFLQDILTKFQSAYEPDAYILTGNKDRFFEPRTYQYRFKTLLKQAGVSEVNFHVLRHTFATQCIEVGFDIKALSEILGHSTVNITLNRYVHPTLEQKQINMDKLNSIYY